MGILEKKPDPIATLISISEMSTDPIATLTSIIANSNNPIKKAEAIQMVIHIIQDSLSPKTHIAPINQLQDQVRIKEKTLEEYLKLYKVLKESPALLELIRTERDTIPQALSPEIKKGINSVFMSLKKILAGINSKYSEEAVNIQKIQTFINNLFFQTNIIKEAPPKAKRFLVHINDHISKFEDILTYRVAAEIALASTDNGPINDDEDRIFTIDIIKKLLQKENLNPLCKGLEGGDWNNIFEKAKKTLREIGIKLSKKNVQVDKLKIKGLCLIWDPLPINSETKYALKKDPSTQIEIINTNHPARRRSINETGKPSTHQVLVLVQGQIGEPSPRLVYFGELVKFKPIERDK